MRLLRRSINLSCKVADFGLARVIDEDIYEALENSASTLFQNYSTVLIM